MPWFFVDDAFADSKPVMRLDRALRNESIGLWVRCGAWSAKEETDGHVPLDTVKQFGGTPRLIKALHEQAELWVESSPESWRNSREILFGNWEKWQKTRSEMVAKRKADAARQAAHRRTRKGRGYVPNDDAASDDAETSRCDTNRDNEPDGTDDSKDVSRCESQRPDPTRPDPTLSVVTSGRGVTSVDDPEPPRFCPDHPDDTPHKCIPCRNARKTWEAWRDREPERMKQQADALRDARENCTRCEGTNTYEDAAGVHKCNHQGAVNE